MPSQKSSPFKAAVKFIWKVLPLIAVLATLAVLFGPRLMKHATPAGSGSVTVKPVPDNSLLINPGKGWVAYGDPDPSILDVIGMGYARTSWCNVEPAEGKYDWSGFDSFISKWARVGRKCSISVINFDGGVGHQYSTPKWVFDAGAVPKEVPDSSTPTGTMILPTTWDDPVYLAKTKAFIAAFGARYNGNPNLAFVDIRDYGNSGECNGDYAGIKNTSQDSLQNNFFAPYIQAFPNTRLIVPWTAAWFDGKPADPVYKWAVSKGVGIRRDGICSHWSKDGSECLLAYGQAPAVFEYADSWAGTVKEGYSTPEVLMSYVNAGKPSYIQFQPEFYAANKEFCRMLGNKMGYHFILQQADIPGDIQPGVSYPIKLTWLNDGVAPLYEPCSVAVALMDKDNNVVARQWIAESKPTSWMPGVVATESFNVTFPSVPSGDTKLAVGLFFNQNDANPAYRLGIQGRINTGWYILSGKADTVPALWTNTTGGSWTSGSNWTGCSYRTGVDAIADFSTLDLKGDATVTLDDAVTVGGLVFGDVTPDHNWLVNSGSNGSLTLSVGSGMPEIIVKNQTATIAAPLISYQGLSKSGSGTLILSGSIGLTGNTKIEGGVLEIAPTTKLYFSFQGSSVKVGAGATLRVNGWSGYGGGWGELDQLPMDNPNLLMLDGGTLEFTGSNTGNGSRAFSFGPQGGTLKNSSAAGWTLAASGTGAQATITNNSSLNLAGAGTNSQLQKGITGTGSLTKTDAGTWILTGTSTYKGPTTVSQGTLQVLGTLAPESAVTVSEGATLSGTGNIRGPLTVNGTLAPGTGTPGSLTAFNKLTLNGTTSMRLSKSGATRLNDSVRGSRSLAYGGTLAVTFTGDVPLSAGDIFTLFSAGSYTGNFATITLPELGAGLQWNSASLTANGSIAVIRTPQAAVRADDQRSITVKPDPDNSLLINPGKGWVMYGEPAYASSPELVKDVIAVGYSRCDWSVLEPKEGEFDWSRIDNFIAAWAKFDRKITWRVMCSDAGVGVQYATPKWVFDAGAAPMEVPDTTSPTGTHVIPKSWMDPVYQAKMKKFIAAFGKRYNGNPNIAFLDMGNYGNWGEGNGTFWPGTENVTTKQLENDFFKPYIDAFPNTQLIVNGMDWLFADAIKWAISKGTGRRIDGICSHWSKDGGPCLLAYGHGPAVFEYADGWEDTVKSGYSSPETLMMYLNGGKPSYIQFQPGFYAENKEFCLMLGNKMGYHFVIQEAHVPSNIKPGTLFQLRLTWLNDGIAPVYEPCYVAMALLDSSDKEVARQWLPECDPKSWVPGESKTDEMMVKFPSVPAGINKFAIGFFHDKKDANPTYKLGIKGRTANGWYVLH
jgi:autotransporter-associated beta strand protein